MSALDVGQLPKVELHCHLLGTITPALLSRVRHSGGPTLMETQELQSAQPVHDLASFRRWIDVLRPYQAATVEAMMPILAAHVGELIAQRVVYTEIMISPTMFPDELTEMLNAFRRWREWAFELEQGEIQIEFVMVVPRTLTADLLARDLQAYLALGRAGLIVGVALVGVEDGQSIQRFAAAFERWREMGLGIEIHAGEHGPTDARVRAVQDALDFGRPDRLGHALPTFENAELSDRIQHERVHVECCPTSNLRTGAVTDLTDHPARQARRLGLSVSLNTDDPGAFRCTITDEYELAASTWGFDAADFDVLYKNSLAARFQPVLRYLRG